MKKISIVLLLVASLQASGQTDSVKAVQEIVAFQTKLNEEYRSREESPLKGEDFDTFQGHDFFPIDLAYRVQATLEVTPNTPFFGMKTTTSRLSQERVYGHVTFTLEGTEFRLPVYQSKDLMQTPEYSDYLFFNFTDQTNGYDTYLGGRYIDLRIPKAGAPLIIDFNMAYNPYCAYSPGYSCPIVPAENHIDIGVEAGVKYHPKPVVNEKPIYTVVDVPAEYPGGYPAMSKFLGKNMTYPKEAMKAKVTGTVYISFVVKVDGSIAEVTSVKGISPECDREAIRVVQLMPKWKPAQVKGQDVASRFVLPINFRGMESWHKK
jgi:TonB family protein